MDAYFGLDLRFYFLLGLRGKGAKLPPSNPAAVNSICTLHAPKHIPKIIAAHGHAFLTFGFQNGDFAEFL